MNSKDVVELQTWWMNEIEKITDQVRKQEEKRKARARSKHEDELAEFKSRWELQDAYGMGCFTERQYNRLMRLWDEREEGQIPSRLYQDKLALLSEVYKTAKEVLEENRKLAERGL